MKIPPRKLFLQHVLNEGQRIAVMLRLAFGAAVVDHKLPFSGHLLGEDKPEGAVTRSDRTPTSLFR